LLRCQHRVPDGGRISAFEAQTADVELNRCAARDIAPGTQAEVHGVNHRQTILVQITVKLRPFADRIYFTGLSAPFSRWPAYFCLSGTACEC
jgi:hypothetical protein